MAKRKLYRNVDGRIIILFMPLKWNFVIFMFTSALFIFFVFGSYSLINKHSEHQVIDKSTESIEKVNQDAVNEKENKKNVVFSLLVITVIFLCANFCINAEFKFRESGLQYLKNHLRYKREGKIIYERSLINVGLSQRFLRNKIKKQFK